MSVDSAILADDLGKRIREAVDQLRPYGVTLSVVFTATACELGRTAASLDDERMFMAWLADFAKVALEAWRRERAMIAKTQDEPAPR